MGHGRSASAQVSRPNPLHFASRSRHTEMTAAMLLRTGSPLTSPASGGDADTGVGMSFIFRSRSAKLSLRMGSVAVALQHDAKQGQQRLPRRVRSDVGLSASAPKTLNCIRSSLPSTVIKEENMEDLDAELFDVRVGLWPTRPPTHSSAVAEVELSGGGFGTGSKFSSGGGGGDQSENRRVGDYYQQMLLADPSNPLLLRNYARFLHEVVGDAKAAEEYYGRAILASPSDGEVLSLYGRLLWETQKDGERAEAYFERAVEASPDDCFVMGSYANFLWDAEEEEEEVMVQGSSATSIPPLLEVF